MPDTTISTTLRESVNIVLANLGETPVNSIASSSSLPLHVSLAINTIEEVSADVQAKGWWFNQQTGGNFDSNADITIVPSNVGDEWSATIPEEARRYITIRAARITQTRLIGSEELQKFSYNEELVSLAILQQAHVRNSNGELTFTAFPSELRNLGIDEVMFLQGNMEEKLAHLRLGTEIANIDKIKAETTLLADQEALVTQQALTEVEETSKRAAEKLLVDEQAGLITKQALTEVQNAIKISAESGLITAQQALVAQQALDSAADVTLKGKQGLLIDKQALTEVQNALKIAAETSLLADQEALVVKQALTEVARATDIAADTALKGKQGALIDAQELKTDAETGLTTQQQALTAQQTIDVAADTTLKGKQGIKTDAETGLVTQQQALTAQQTLDVAADTTLKGKQGSLIDAQELKTDAETTLTSNQSDLIASQKTELDAKTAIEATAEKAFYDGVVAGTQATYRDFAAEMRMMGIQESMFQSTPAYKKVELLKDAEKLRTVTATETGSDATELLEVNRVMRLIGEPPVTALNQHSLASECVRLLRDTDTELQGRGWYFNTDDDDVITQKPLDEAPRKYLEYLEVRVAILLTELYPQSGVDIQRLPKMEQELRAYFKDREFDDASYSVFDNYDVAARLGVNRPHNIF